MYGSDAGQPVPSLYTKGLSPLCDIIVMSLFSICQWYLVNAVVINFRYITDNYLVNVVI